jgi:hypothetical protein
VFISLSLGFVVAVVAGVASTSYYFIASQPQNLAGQALVAGTLVFMGAGVVWCFVWGQSDADIGAFLRRRSVHVLAAVGFAFVVHDALLPNRERSVYGIWHDCAYFPTLGDWVWLVGAFALGLVGVLIYDDVARGREMRSAELRARSEQERVEREAAENARQEAKAREAARAAAEENKNAVARVRDYLANKLASLHPGEARKQTARFVDDAEKLEITQGVEEILRDNAEARANPELRKLAKKYGINLD